MKVVTNYLATDDCQMTCSGPISPFMVSNAYVSQFGVIPMSHQPNKWRLMVDFSHQHRESANDGVRNDLCSIAYISVDDAINQIIPLGKGTLQTSNLVKIVIRMHWRILSLAIVSTSA